MSIAEKYINGLKKAYYDNGGRKEWDEFESVIHGASDEDITRLKEIYPEAPDSLIELLKFVDGTYWREYQGRKIAFYFLGSDINGYPYYILPAKEIANEEDMGFEYYADYINREFDDVGVDEKIIDDANKLKWLHFSDCMNNGGTSQIFIDFSPSEKGVSGQVIRFLHDPDEIEVIADSFDEYLQMLIDNNFDFINEDTIEY